MKQQADTYVVTYRKPERYCVYSNHYLSDLQNNYEQVEFKRFQDARKFAESLNYASMHALFPIFKNTLSVVWSGYWSCTRTGKRVRALKKHLHTPVWEVEPSYRF